MEIFKNNIEKLERLTRRERLGELLVRDRLLKIDKLVELMEEHRKSSLIPFGEFLVEKSLLSRQDLIEFLNRQKVQDRIIDNCLQDLGFMTNQKKWETITR